MCSTPVSCEDDVSKNSSLTPSESEIIQKPTKQCESESHPSKVTFVEDDSAEVGPATQRMAVAYAEKNITPSNVIPPSMGVSVDVRPIDRKTKIPIQSLAKDNKTDRFMESAGNYGDVEDSSDYDWDC